MISDARIVTTTRAGYAQNGDRNHHAIFLANDRWSEDGVTWNNRPSDGTVAPGNPNLAARGRHPVVSAGPRLGVHVQGRHGCELDPDSAGNQQKVFPTNDGDESKTFAASKADLIGRVATERAG